MSLGLWFFAAGIEGYVDGQSAGIGGGVASAAERFAPGLRVHDVERTVYADHLVAGLGRGSTCTW